jgi:hypothetical protein
MHVRPILPVAHARQSRPTRRHLGGRESATITAVTARMKPHSGPGPMLNAAPPIRDGDQRRLKAVAADAQAPGRPGIGNASLIVAAMALRHLNDRLEALEQRMTGQGQAPPDQRLAEAQRRHANMVAEMKIAKLEETVSRHEASKEPNDNLEPSRPKDQPQLKDERVLAFDPSSGDNAQSTEKFPLGVPPRRRTADMVKTPTRDEYERMKFEYDARENRAFRDRGKAMTARGVLMVMAVPPLGASTLRQQLSSLIM